MTRQAGKGRALIANGTVLWRRSGQDLHYGFYRERDSVWRADILITGTGEFEVFVEDDKVGSVPTLEAAQAAVEHYFEAGRHHQQTFFVKGEGTR
jgi:hypothetical protein